ncbi:UNVERIFIED_CONTAM: hypothetical protein FKN15_011902 [Acipenser sinensis]
MFCRRQGTDTAEILNRIIDGNSDVHLSDEDDAEAVIEAEEEVKKQEGQGMRRQTRIMTE